MTMPAPASRAFAWAALSWLRTSSSRVTMAAPASDLGGMLISRLNWPSSVWNAGSSISSSTSLLRMAGSPWSSTRLSSISMPVSGSSKSNWFSASIRSSTSRQRWTFSR